MTFKKINIKELIMNPMKMISEDWMLLTAGNQTSFNTMTISWGHLGSLWGHGGGKATSVVYVRPQRYTKEFMEREDYYTLSVFDHQYKKALGYLGSHSGRDSDKVKEAGLTPYAFDNGIAFDEAKIVFVCKKLYHGKIEEEGFVDKNLIDDNYPNKDFHDIYIGEIIEAYINE